MTVAEGGGVFVSYRRQESSHLAGRLYDRLADRFGEGQVFIDVDAIEPGVDFAEEIFRAVAACKVLLAIIGPNWLTAADERGGRRLDDPGDIVRLEVEAALARGVRVIPILVDGAVMPGREDLPESLADLARRKALLIRHESFRYDAERLVTAIERILAVTHGAAATDANRAERVADSITDEYGTGWITWARRARTGPPAAGQDFGRLADLLAAGVRAQWERAAGERGLVTEPIPVSWGRPSLPLAGPPAAAAGSQRFAPLPGMAPVSEAQLSSGQISDLYALYAGLGSGRLVIAGEPGSGKSGAAVLLVLVALAHRDQARPEDRVKIPVPLLFTAQDWDPRRQPARDWLTRRMHVTYPLFAGRTGTQDAARLIDAGKIAVILDGLDEISAGLQPAALQALSQAAFRVVVLSRTAEMALAASQHGMLHGAAAIELRPVGPSAAAEYLEHVQLDPPPDGWRDLVTRIRSAPASPLASALSTPLMLTLIRDTYHTADDARELLACCDAAQQRLTSTQAAEEITGYLLDRVLPSAYARRPGHPPSRYDLRAAQNALTKIAARMNQDGTRDLHWWRIPEWAPPAQRIIAGGLTAGLAVGLTAGFTAGLGGELGPGAGLGDGLLTGLIAGVVTGFGAYGRKDPPARRGRLRLRLIFTRANLVAGLAGGLVAGIGFMLVTGLAAGLAGGLVTGLVIGLGFGLGDAFADPDSASSPSPAAAWKDDRNHALAVGLVAGLAGGLGAGLVTGVGLGLGLRAGLVTGLGAGLGAGLGFSLLASHIWASMLAMAQLARKWRTPVHLMNFLDDARERNVLRTVGPVYQFRHARLQDRLAAAADGPSRKTNPGKTNSATTAPRSAAAPPSCGT